MGTRSVTYVSDETLTTTQSGGIAMSYKPAFIFAGQAEPSTNGQAFATYQEAFASAEARFRAWTMPTDFAVITSDEPVNYVWDVERGDVPCVPA